MRYCGMDVAAKSSYVSVTDERGLKLLGQEVATEKGALRAVLEPQLAGGLAVAVEVGNQTAWIHDLLVSLGAEVTVVNVTKVRFFAAAALVTQLLECREERQLERLLGTTLFERPPPHFSTAVHRVHFRR